MTLRRPPIDEVADHGDNPEQVAIRAQRLDPDAIRQRFAEDPTLEARFGPADAVIARLAAHEPEPTSSHRDPLGTSRPKRLRRNSLPHVPAFVPAPDLDELRAALAVTARLGPMARPTITPEARRIAQAALDAAQDGDSRVPIGAVTYRAGVSESAVRNAVKALAWHSHDVWIKPAGEPAQPMFREYLDTAHDRRMRAAFEARSRFKT